MHIILQYSLDQLTSDIIQIQLQEMPSSIRWKRNLHDYQNSLRSILSPSSSTLPKESPHQVANANFKEARSSPQIQSLIENISTKMLQEKPPSKHRNHTYAVKHPLLKCVVSPFFPVPTRVTQAYNTAETDNRKVNFTQGHLAKAGLIYYAVEQAIFFYDARQLVKGSITLQDTFLGCIETEDITNQIAEVHFPSPLVRQGLRKNILILAHPWKLTFYSYQLHNKILRVTNLQLSHHFHHSLLASHICSSPQGNIYYLDCNTNCHTLTTQPNHALLKFILGRPSHQLAHSSHTRGIGLLSYYRNNRKLAANALSYYYNFIKAAVTPLLWSPTYKNYSLLYDPTRKILFSLTQATQIDTTYRIITAYNHKLQLITTVGEPQLNQRRFQSDKNLSIVNIFLLPPANRANLQVVTNTGIRHYLYIEKDRVQIIEQIHPPDIPLLLQQGVSETYTHLVSTAHKSLTLLVSRDQFHNSKTLLLTPGRHPWVEEATPVEWSTGNQVNLDLQLTALQPLSTSNEYAHQVYHPPTSVLYSSSKWLQFITILRPIDLMYSLIEQPHSCIQLALPHTAIKDILCMKLQIATHPDAEYKRLKLLQIRIQQYHKNVVLKNKKQPLLSKQFQLSLFKKKQYLIQKQEIITEKCLPALSQYAINYINRYVCCKENYTSAELQLDTLPKEQKPQSKYTKLFQNTIQQSILLYIARLLQPVWLTCLPHIGEGQFLIKNRIERLNKFLPRLISSAPISHFLQKSMQLLIMCKFLRKLPPITFQQGITFDFITALFDEAMDCYREPVAAVERWIDEFPLYAGQVLLRAVKIGVEAKRLPKEQIPRMLQEHQNIPQCLINYVKRELDVSEAFISLVPVPKLLPVDNPLQQIQHSLHQFIVGRGLLNTKRALLQRAQQLLTKCRSECTNEMQWRRLHQLRGQYEKRLKVQSLLLREYKQMSAEGQISRDSLDTLNRQTLSEELLQAAVQALQCKQLIAVHSLLLRKAQLHGQAVRNAVVQVLSRAGRGAKEKLVALQQCVQYIYSNAAGGFVPLLLATMNSRQVPDVVNYGELKQSIMYYAEHCRYRPQLYVVGVHLIQLGSEVPDIMNHFYDVLSKQSPFKEVEAGEGKTLPFATRIDFLYAWLNYFEIVRIYAPEDKLFLTKITQMFLKQNRTHVLIEEELATAIEKCLQKMH